MQLEIQRTRHHPKSFEIGPGIYTVGSDDDCKICLDHKDVDPRHAVLDLRPSVSWVEDLASTTGTRVNNVTVQGRQPVEPGQYIEIGPFRLFVHPDKSPPPPPPPAAERPEQGEVPSSPPPPSPSGPSPSPAPALSPQILEKHSVKQQIQKELVARLDIKRLSASADGQDELSHRARHTIEAIVAEVSPRLPPHITPATLIKEVYEEAVGLGPLEDLLADEAITEIMVNGHSRIYVESKGKLTLTDRMFMDDTSVLAIIERIVSPIGRRIDESQPYVDARLPDGSRVNAVIHPLSLVGPCITIRKFSKTPFTDRDLIRFGTMTAEFAEFAKLCVLLRKNIVVSGGTGSGKTSLLNVLSNYLPTTDRIVTIEDAAELRLGQDHVIRLEARPPNIEGRGAVTIRDLVRNALRMRPDRIVVGECRGGEALDMLQAMNTGHDGSLTTAHANSPRDVISRLETMVLMSGMDLPIRAIREQISAAIDVVIHESRFSDGSRKITKITEIVGQEGDQITMQDIFEYRQTGVDDAGRVLGYFTPTGAVPTFVEDIEARGLSIDRAMFDPSRQET